MPRSRTLAALALATLAPRAHAFTLCDTWDGDMQYDICLDEAGTTCSGDWQDRFHAAMSSWNQTLAPYDFVELETDPGMAPENNENEVGWATAAWRDATYGVKSATVLATEYTWWVDDISCGTIRESDILFVLDHDWTTDREAADSGGPYFFDAVAAHELGHAATLRHEDDYFTLMNSIVHGTPGVYGSPHTDEIAGILASDHVPPLTRDHALLPYIPNGLQVDPPTVSPLALNAGEDITVGGLSVQNWGTNTFEDVEVTFVLSTNEIGSASDVEVKRLTWSNLSRATGLIDGEVMTIPPIAPGSYHLIAVADIDNVVTELTATNNQWSIARLAITGEPDLSVRSVTLDSTSGTTADTVPVWATRENLGTATAGAARMSVRFSTNTTITVSDPEGCAYDFGPLDAGAGVRSLIQCDVPDSLAPGAYYVGLIVDVDDAVAESNETNNTAYGATPYTVTAAGQADLAVSNVVASVSTAEAGDSFRVDYTRRNDGTLQADPYVLSVRLSTNTTITTSDPEMCSATITGHDAGDAVSTFLLGCEVPPATLDGTYYVGVLMDRDDDVVESDETNNTGYDPTGLVVGPGVSDVDLTVSGVWASEDRLGVGDVFRANYTRSNLGTQAAGAYRLSVRLSANTLITASDPEVCGADITSHAALTDVSTFLSCAVPDVADGTWYLGVIVDEEDTVAETDEANNTGYDPVPITVGPTLHLPTITPGQSATFRVTGAQPGEQVEFLVSLRSGSGPCYAPGVCTDLVNPKIAGTVTADANGAASVTRNVPSTVSPGRTVYGQALITGGVTRLTPLETEVVQ